MPFKFYLKLFVFIFLFSCSQDKGTSRINKENLTEKIYEAIQLSEDFEDISLGVEVLHYIDKYKPKINDLCVIKALSCLRFLRQLSIDGYNLDISTLNLAFKSDSCKDNYLKSLAHNLYAIYYSSINKSIAIENYKKSILFGDFLDDKKVIIDPLYNLTVAKYEQSKYEDVLILCNKAIEALKHSSQKQNREKLFYAYKAKANIGLRNFLEAEKSLNKALEIANSDEAKAFAKDDIYNAKRLIYNSYALLNKELNNNNFYYKYHIKSDSLTNLWEKENAKSRYQILKEDNILKEDLLKTNEKVIFTQRLLLFVILLFMIIVLILYYRVTKAKKKLFVSINEKEVMNNELKTSLKKIEEANNNLIKKTKEVEELLKVNEQSLFSKTLKLTNYKDAVDGVLNQLNKLLENSINVNADNLKFINNSLQGILSEEEIWHDFKTEFEKSRPEFFTKLLNYNSKLSIIEQKHCAYVAVNLKSKEVATILNLSPRSVETARYRIKKKLNLVDESLLDFLRKI